MSTVRTVTLHRCGDPGALAIEEVPIPKPEPVEVLVREAQEGSRMGQVRAKLILQVASPLPCGALASLAHKFA